MTNEAGKHHCIDECQNCFWIEEGGYCFLYLHPIAMWKGNECPSCSPKKITIWDTGFEAYD